MAAALSTLFAIASIAGAEKSGAQESGGDLSSVGAAKSYLISQGYDPSKFVFQVGLNNYAGPTCPGLDWNCTRAALVVQITTPGGVNYAECGAGARRCIVFQGGRVDGPIPLSAGDMNMHAHCGDPEAGEKKRMMLKESGALTCEITQTNPTTGNNHAVVGMSIHDNDDPAQDGTEDATVVQSTNGDGDNHAVVHEQIVLATRDESATQVQDGFQYLNLTQDTETGDNSADVKQTQKLTAQARLPATKQKQNTDELTDPCLGPSSNANTCVRFEQFTESGRNDLNVHQDHNVEAVGAGGQQNQGCAIKECTLEVDGSQKPLGSTNTVDNNQSVTYTLRGPAGTTQIQDPKIANGPGLQLGSPNDLWKVRQLAVLVANDADDYDDAQEHINQVDDTSTGTVDAQSVIILNGERSEIVCNGSSCNYFQACGVGEGFCPDFSDESPPID